MKVVVADQVSQEGIEQLKAMGWEVDYNPKYNDATLIAALSGATALIVRSKQVTQKILSSQEASGLALVIRAGAGVDNIHLDTANQKGIMVCNCPGKNSVAVAELAFGLMLFGDRRLSASINAVKTGEAVQSEVVPKGLEGRVLGIIGLGAIGQAISKRAQVFGARVIAYDKYLPKHIFGECGVEEKSTIDEIITEADFVTLHVNYTNETKDMVNAAFLAKMKKDALLMNTARGQVVDENALKAHLDQNPAFVYVTDVPTGEPAAKEGDWQWHLAKHPQVFTTHHIGASTNQAEEDIGKEAVRIMDVFLKEGKPPARNIVNKPMVLPVTAKVTVSYDPNTLDFLFQAPTFLNGVGAKILKVETSIVGNAVVATLFLSVDAAKFEEITQGMRALQGIFGVTFSKV